MRLPNLRMVFFLCLIAPFFAAYAQTQGSLRVGAMGGLGSAGAESAASVIDTEGPMAFGAYVDYALEPRISLGVEHLRSFNGGSSAIGCSSLTGKWYFYTPQPQILRKDTDQITENYLIQKYYTPYIGFAAGFGQASFPATNTNPAVVVANPYLGLKFGIERPWVGRWGLRGEFNYGATFGSGEIEMVHVFLSIYYFL